MYQGTIARLVRDRGFGFVRDKQGTEYFFHRSGCVPDPLAFDTLTEGSRVTFEIDDKGDKGPRAKHVASA